MPFLSTVVDLVINRAEVDPFISPPPSEQLDQAGGLGKLKNVLLFVLWYAKSFVQRPQVFWRRFDIREISTWRSVKVGRLARLEIPDRLGSDRVPSRLVGVVK